MSFVVSLSLLKIFVPKLHEDENVGQWNQPEPDVLYIRRAFIWPMRGSEEPIRREIYVLAKNAREHYPAVFNKWRSCSRRNVLLA